MSLNVIFAPLSCCCPSISNCIMCLRTSVINYDKKINNQQLGQGHVRRLKVRPSFVLSIMPEPTRNPTHIACISYVIRSLRSWSYCYTYLLLDRNSSSKKETESLRALMANTITGVAVGLSCSTPKHSQRPSSRFSHSSRHFCTVKMAVSLDEKKKSFTLEKSEKAFNAAKVQFPSYLSLLSFQQLLRILSEVGCRFVVNRWEYGKDKQRSWKLGIYFQW